MRPYSVTPAMADLIRKGYKVGRTMNDLARQHRVSRSTVSSIVRGRHGMAEGAFNLSRGRGRRATS